MKKRADESEDCWVVMLQRERRACNTRTSPEGTFKYPHWVWGRDLDENRARYWRDPKASFIQTPHKSCNSIPLMHRTLQWELFHITLYPFQSILGPDLHEELKYASDSRCVVAFNSTTVIFLASDDTYFTMNLSFNFQQNKWTENKPPPIGSYLYGFVSCAVYLTKNYEG